MNFQSFPSRTEDAKRIMKRAAKENKVKVSEQEWQDIMACNEEELEADLANDVTEEEVEIEVKFWHLFKSACMRKRLIIMYVNYIAVTLCYSGLTLHAVNLGMILLSLKICITC